MKKVLITSAKFTGQAEITYDAAGKLLVLDVSDATMPSEALTLFKRAVPVLYDNLADALQTCTIIPADVVITFEMFWKLYPLKRNRYKAAQYWEKMNETDKVNAFSSLKAYNKYCTKTQWYNPMIADKYLRAREFETDWQTILKQQQ